MILKCVLQGIVIGAAAVIPGVSGGVLAAAMGVYEPIITAFSDFFKAPRAHFRFLAPYIIGGAAGFLLFSGIAGALFEYAPKKTLLLFSGLVIGGIPSLLRSAARDGFSFKDLLIAAAAYLFMTALSPLFSLRIENTFLRFFVGGAVYSFGSVVPGISASFILINMGIYRELLAKIASPAVFIPFIIGFLPTSAALIRGIGILFKKHRAAAHFAVVGLLCSNIITALPAISSPVSDILPMLFGAAASYIFFNR